MNDLHLIKHKGYRFSADHYHQLHAARLVFIQHELKTNKEEQVAIFTHHCSTCLNYPEQYKGNVLNEAFAVELFHLIESSNIDYWAHGITTATFPNSALVKPNS